MHVRGGTLMLMRVLAATKLTTNTTNATPITIVTNCSHLRKASGVSDVATETPMMRAVAQGKRDRTTGSYCVIIPIGNARCVVRLRDALGGDAYGVVLRENGAMLADGIRNHVGGLVHD